MSRFYVYSQSGDGDCLAYRLHTEDEDVVLRIEEPWCRANLEGIVQHTQADPRQGDIVIFGTSKAGQFARQLRREGFTPIGASPLADRMEMDRWFFTELCHELRVPTPQTDRFTDYGAARVFLKRNAKTRYVFKPSGDQEAATTFVASDAEEMVAMLDNLAKQTKGKVDFLLQEFVEGQEISLEGWFNGTDWVEGAWNATRETKKLMAGDIGPATGCSTSIVYPYDDEPSWARKLHRRFTERLRADHYVGPFDLNTIQTEDGMFVLETCCRFGYDAIQNYAELFAEPFGVVMEQLAMGSLDYLDVDTHSLSASMRLAIPPYPSSSKEHRAPDDVPVLIDRGDLEHLWASGIREEDGDMYSAPTDGVVGALVVVGTDVNKVNHQLCEIAGRCKVPNLMYRNDVGSGHMVMWEQLAAWDFPLPPLIETLLEKKPAVLPRAPFAHHAWRAV